MSEPTRQKFIQSNIVSLTNSTTINTELVIYLLEKGLIVDGEKQNLVWLCLLLETMVT